MTEHGTEGVGSGNSCSNCDETVHQNTEDLNEPIEINLDQDIYDSLLEIYVRENLMPESYKVYEDYIASGADVKEAVCSAIVNDMANYALKDELERHKNDEIDT